MELDPDTSDVKDAMLDDAPLTERTAPFLERDRGTLFAEDAPAHAGSLIANEWRHFLPLLRARALARSAPVRTYRDVMWGPMEAGHLFCSVSSSAMASKLPRHLMGPYRTLGDNTI